MNENEQKIKVCTIIIPCFNEGNKIAKAADSLFSFLKEQEFFFWQIVLVDDGSTDNTKEEIVRVVKEKNNDSRIIFSSVFLEQNQGKGGAIQAGLKNTSADIYGYFDVDLSVDYRRLIPALELLNNDQIALVAGQRKDVNFSGYSLFRKIGSLFFNWIARVLFHLPYQDIQCGFKFFNKLAKEQALLVERQRFSFDLEFLLCVHQAGLNIKPLELDWQHSEESSVSWKDAVRYFLDLVLISELVYTRKQWLFFYFFSSFIITFLLFGWVIFYGYFFSDDFTWIWHGWKILTGQISVLKGYMSSFYSPVLNAFYAFSVAIFGLSSWWYFFFGLMVHVINSFLVGLLGREISHSSATGFVATALFALVGGAYEPLVWIGANMHSLAVLFMLVSVLCLFFSFATQSYRRWCYLLFSLFAMVLAFGTKEIAVITPVLLFFSFVLFFRDRNNLKKIWQQKEYIVYGVGVVFLSILYFWQEFLAQRTSVWVTSGALSFSPKLLLRLPLALADVFVPLGHFLRADNAIIFLLVAGFLLFLLAYRFISERAIFFAAAWSTMAALVVLFFGASKWWEVLPSRYTYSVRVGVVLIVAVLLIKLMRQAHSQRVVQWFFWVLILVIGWQIYSMAVAVKTEYPYVYNTGRNLLVAVEEINRIQPHKVIVEWERPFERNFAHVVGLLEYQAQIPENRVLFLSAGKKVFPQTGEVVLRWDMKEKKYQVLLPKQD